MSRRMKNIYKRKDGRWEARYIREYDINGKAKYCSLYAHSYHEARQKLLEADTNKSKIVSCTEALTLTDWFSEWMHVLRSSVKPSTYAVYERYFNNHIKPFMGELYMTALSTDIIQRFIDSREGLSPTSVKGIFLFLKSGLSAAEEKQLIKDIWSGVRLPKRSEKGLIRVFSKSEQRDLENAVASSGNPNDIGILICLYTGLRIGELCGLMWEDINFKASVLSVRRTVQRISINQGEKKTSVVIMPPKSISSLRDIPIPRMLMGILSEHKRLYGGSKYVINNEGRMIEPRYYQYRFAKILKNANIKPAKFHTTRHTFATRALESGMDIKTLSEILGHADAVITMKRYAHSSDEQKRCCIEKLADSVFSNFDYGQIYG